MASRTPKQEQAVTTFLDGATCTQAVLTAFCEEYGLSTELAMKLGSSAGGGFKCSDVCGAASGGALVVGLRCGHTVPSDKVGKDFCTAKTREYMHAFRDRHGHITCLGLLGSDINTPEGRAAAMSKNLLTTYCADLVADVVKYLEDNGY